MKRSKLENISERIKAKAREIGFDLAGIARAEPIDARFLDRWLKNDYHGTMQWMRRTADRRTDPQKFLPGAKSVIATAVNYYSDDPARPANTGQVSRYAVGRDYHAVFEEKLPELLDYVTELMPGAEGRIAVDYTPLPDKIWAALAGIGWIGKHSNLISREFGSYILLGEIVIDRELAYDRPVVDHCGTCRLCIDACPTGAIVEPYVVDSRRCISYRTIEYRGGFPEEWSAENGDWLFGCDVCQEVCPWNKFSRETGCDDLKAARGRRFLPLDGIERMTEREFAAEFRDSPVKRSKLSGLQRNAREVRSFFERVKAVTRSA